MDSDLAGVIGLVRGTQIDCIPIRRFAYVLEQKREACIEPSRLIVRHEKFQTRYEALGRPWTGKVGGAYYSIGQK